MTNVPGTKKPATHRQQVHMQLVRTGRNRGKSGDALQSHFKGGLKNFDNTKKSYKKARRYGIVNKVGKKITRT